MHIALRTGTALLGVGLAVALLAGCGADETGAGAGEQETSSEPSDKSQEPSPTESESVPPGPIEFTAIALVSGSNVDGTVSPRAVVLDSEKSRQRFAGRFNGPRMGLALRKEYARADLPKGEVLLGAVVDVSCQPPSELQVEKTRRGVEVTATTKVSKNVQCLVPVTTVALVSVPEAAV